MAEQWANTRGRGPRRRGRGRGRGWSWSYYDDEPYMGGGRGFSYGSYSGRRDRSWFYFSNTNNNNSTRRPGSGRTQQHSELTNGISKSNKSTPGAVCANVRSRDLETSASSETLSSSQQSDSSTKRKVTQPVVKDGSQGTETFQDGKKDKLLAAVEMGSVDEVKDLLSQCENNGSFSQDVLESCLIQAAKKGYKFIVQRLIYAGAKPSSNFKEQDGNTALLSAAELGHTDIVKLLISHKARLDVTNKNKDTALHLAIHTRGSSELISTLISHGVQINSKNQQGKTALMKALEVRDLDAVKLLIDAGVKTGIKNHKNETALDIAWKQGLAGVVSLMCEERHSRKKETALMKAVAKVDKDSVQLLLDCQQVNINKVSKNGNVLMQLVKSLCSSQKPLCMRTNELHILKLLLQRGAVMDVNQMKGNTPLIVATEAGELEVVRLLCELHKSCKLDTFRNDRTALMIAAEKGRCDLIKLLLKHGATLSAKNHFGESALLIALKFGQVESAKLLLSRGAEIDLQRAAQIVVENGQHEALKFLISKYKLDVDANFLLHRAIKKNLEDVAVVLVDSGAKVNVQNMAGRTPLSVAIKDLVQKSLVKYLIDHGADVNDDTNSDDLPLLLALNCSLEMVRLLLDSGAEVNKTNHKGETALMLACSKSLVAKECVRFLLENKASPNLKDSLGRTALHFAVESGDVEKINLLVDYGADLEATTNQNETPYLKAVRSLNLIVIKRFHDMEVNVNVQDSLERNAILIAINARSPALGLDKEVLKCIVEQGVSINHRDRNGVTPLMLAANQGNSEAMTLLLELKADVHIVNTVEPERKQVTALSILLEKSDMFHKQDLVCMEEMIKQGAVNSLPSRCSGMLHKMIMMDRRKMIQLLLSHGMAPSMSDLQPVLYRLGPFLQMEMLRFTLIEASPLSVALAAGNVRVAQFLLGNLILCPCDVGGHSHYKNLRDYLVALSINESVNFLDNYCSQPSSLFQLCFITVSHAVGGTPGRVERVSSLPLPSKIKDKLLFRSNDVPMDFTSEASPPSSNGDNYGYDDFDDDPDDDDNDDDHFFLDYDDPTSYFNGDDSDECLYFGQESDLDSDTLHPFF